jgi:putative sigma-54 modulation protein
MFVFVRALVDVVTSAHLRRESERRLKLAAAPFQGQIREIGIVLRDVNGPRGGVDKRCTVIARLRRGGSIEIEETSTTFVESIRGAAKRLRSLLGRRIGGKRARNTLRRPGVWGVA